jgi:PAS domain-containing protein
MGDGRVDALNSAVAELSGLPREVRLLERCVEALEEERRALFAELEAWMRRVRTLDQVLKGDTP